MGSESSRLLPVPLPCSPPPQVTRLEEALRDSAGHLVAMAELQVCLFIFKFLNAPASPRPSHCSGVLLLPPALSSLCNSLFYPTRTFISLHLSFLGCPRACHPR